MHTNPIVNISEKHVFVCLFYLVQLCKLSSSHAQW